MNARALTAALVLVLLAAASCAAGAGPSPFAGRPEGSVSVGEVAAVGRWAYGSRVAPQQRPEEAAAAVEGAMGLGKHMTCDQCEGYIKLFGSLIENNATRAAILGAVEAKCAKLGGLKAVCDKVAAFVVDKLAPWLTYKLDSPPYDPAAVCAFLGKCKINCCQDETAPEQLHLSYGPDPSQMILTWVTQEAPAGGPAVRWGTSAGSLASQAQGDTRTYTFAGWVGQVHSATMTGLRPNTTYHYQAGSPGQWSQGSTVYSFTTLPARDPATGQYPRPIRLAVLGDMGMNNSHATRDALVKLAESGQIDAILHNGDISYADGAQAVWDEYMRWIEPYAARVPMMVTIGNHEQAFVLGYAYKARFTMPKVLHSDGNMYYSFNVGPVHVLALSTESVVNTPYVTPEGLAYVRHDLAVADTAAARAEQPWVVAAGHRPLYCADTSNIECGIFAAYLRQTLEREYHAHHADLVFGAHRHSYQRSHPLYAGHVVTSGQAPTYVLNGAAGNREGLNHIDNIPWLASGAKEFSYGIIEADHASLTYTQYLSANMTAIDSFTLSKK